MDQRDRLDPESRTPLESLLEEFPGGFGAITDPVVRRAAERDLIARLTRDIPPDPRVAWENLVVPGPPGAPDVDVRLYRPVGAGTPTAGILFVQGGGMVTGDLDSEHLTAERLCAEVGAVVLSADYRRAPEHPHPAQVDDCCAALVALAARSDSWGVDAARLAAYGGSAGGNLCLATALVARDGGGPPLQLLMAPYPMLDDRNETPSSREITDVGAWDRAANLQAWEWFLGGRPADGYAAPARCPDLSGLPPVFLDVGDVDLFRDEDVDFAQRLAQAGVPVELHVYPGAYHASEVTAPAAELSRRIWATRLAALRRALS